MLRDSFSEKEKDGKEILAKNDSLAYIEAYRNFCISRLANMIATKEMGTSFSTPVRFQLFTLEGVSVSPIKDLSVLEDIEKQVMALNSSDNAEMSPVVIDSAEIKRLSPFFDFKKDEFDPKGMTWVEPKSRPAYRNRNGIYCYFMSSQGEVSNFRLTIQYYAENWLFVRKCQFSIDGKAYEFIPMNVERDHSGGYIWEWVDERVSAPKDWELIKALSAAKSARIKFIGDQYSEIKTISPKQIKGIKDALELYVAMGGRF